MSDDVKALLAQMNQLTASMGDTIGELDAATQDRRRRATCRNASVIQETFAAIERVAAHVSRMRLGDVYSFDRTGHVFVEPCAMGLIEWFYAMTGPKKVTAHRSKYSQSAFISVQGLMDGETITVTASYDSPKTDDMIMSSAEPSVHLLRRLQIAGA